LVRSVRPTTDEATERSLMREYSRCLPARLAQRRGNLMPNVAEVLAHLSGRSDVVVGLITGNVRDGARAKLTTYGIVDFFEFECSGFAEDGFDRADIGRAAMRRVEAMRRGPINRNGVFLVGDTPFDLRCAAALGIRAVAVATGTYTRADLESEEPWWACDTLPGPTDVLTRLQIETDPPAPSREQDAGIPAGSATLRPNRDVRANGY
jgi:phosphoglycolate phosphatase